MTERKPGESRADHRLRAKDAYDKATEARKPAEPVVKEGLISPPPKGPE